MSDTEPAKREDTYPSADTAHSIERSEQLAREGIMLSSFETGLPVQSDDHHVISTGNYYQTESRGFSDYTDDEAQEWESDGESGEL